MSDQTPGLTNLGSVDGRNLINVPGGGGGISSINGDATAVQSLAGIGAITVTDLGGGAHTIAVALPLPTPPFAPGVSGIVTDPGAALPADYLRADNTFAPLPAALASINADTTAAQTLTGSGLSVIDTGGGGHLLSVDFPEFILGVGINLNLQAAASYNLFNVPGGFAGAVVTKVVMVLVAGDPSVTGDGNFVLNSTATAGVNDYWNDAAGTSNFSPTNNKQVAVISRGSPAAPGPMPLYPAGDAFNLVSAGGTDPATFMVYVFGFLVS